MADVIYAYVDGSNLERVAAAVRARCEALLAGRHWASRIDLVDHRRVGAWDLGLNIEIPRRLTPELEDEVVALGDFLAGRAHDSSGPTGPAA